MMDEGGDSGRKRPLPRSIKARKVKRQLSQRRDSLGWEPCKLYFCCKGLMGKPNAFVDDLLKSSSKLPAFEAVDKDLPRSWGFITFSSPGECELFYEAWTQGQLSNKGEPHNIDVEGEPLKIARASQPLSSLPPEQNQRPEKRQLPGIVEPVHEDGGNRVYDGLPKLLELKKRRLARSDDASFMERVLPLSVYAYPTQLRMRSAYIRTCMKQLTKAVRARMLVNEDPFPAWCRAKGLHGIPVEETVGCTPVARVGYRNKCEFTLGRNKSGKACAGFVCAVQHEEPVVHTVSGMLHVPNCMQEICHTVSSVLEGCETLLPVYSRKQHLGVFRLLVCRRSSQGLMLCVQIFKNENPQSQAAIRESVKTLFVEKICKKSYDGELVVSLYIQERSATSDSFTSSDASDGDSLAHAWGKTHLVQNLMGVKFPVGPMSFFQTNTEACESLYRTAFRYIGNDCGLLLDVCCGIGTIGLTYAQWRRDNGCESDLKVVGIDVVPEAILDAQQSVDKNSFGESAQFVCGKAEDTLGKVLENELKKQPSRVSAIVDPPRAGLHDSVLETLRNCQVLERLVYISCNPESFAVDAVKLCTPVDDCRNVFVPIAAVAVDMFPHTMHCETVVNMVRYTSLTVEDKSAIAANLAVPKTVIPSPPSDDEVFGMNRK
eukprot:GHVN01015353.1.p1 GENE.GHVN01015353.1~~GHVN01015353.1.p1  ORF type:complete len:659 (+),score=37.53 GHVN01015353.1:728-2704(+)